MIPKPINCSFYVMSHPICSHFGRLRRVWLLIVAHVKIPNATIQCYAM